jgi:hypothetical protein
MVFYFGEKETFSKQRQHFHVFISYIVDVLAFNFIFRKVSASFPARLEEKKERNEINQANKWFGRAQRGKSFLKAHELAWKRGN